MKYYLIQFVYRILHRKIKLVKVCIYIRNVHRAQVKYTVERTHVKFSANSCDPFKSLQLATFHLIYT